MANYVFLLTPINDSLPCGKLVQNPVQKYVGKLFITTVEKGKMFKRSKIQNIKTHKFSTFKQKCTNKINKIYTFRLSNYYLKIPSFPLFPHRTITTITTFK